MFFDEERSERKIGIFGYKYVSSSCSGGCNGGGSIGSSSCHKLWHEFQFESKHHWVVVRIRKDITKKPAKKSQVKS